MTVSRTATRLRPGVPDRAAPAHPGQLAALRDEPVSGVPDLGLLVEPAAADAPAPGGDPQQPRRGSAGGPQAQDSVSPPGSSSVPVVIVDSITQAPPWSKVARAVAAVLPCLSQATRNWAGSGRGRRRK